MMLTSDFITLEDLGVAYRKAKVDLFYYHSFCKKALSAFELNLSKNLLELRTILQDEKVPLDDEQYWTLIPKVIKVILDGEPEENVISSAPQQLWQTICYHADKKNKKVQVEFRLMEQFPISFHVFSALWINKVGHKFEEKLSDTARGNRLRRGKSGKINSLSLGSTVPYLHAYCKWRDDAFDTMKIALEQDKSIVAVTADVSSFYHKLNPEFMIDDEFIGKIDVDLSEDERLLHELFISSLVKWAEKTPLKTGLPVGLAASSVIANVALFELDQLFEQEVVPLYYGRYVDDIIFVMENGAGFKSSEDVWDWISKRMHGSLDWKTKKKKDKIEYRQSYLKGSEIIFANEKNKTFLLSGTNGYSVLASIRQTVQKRTSEWRALPNLPNNEIQLESMLLSTMQQDGIAADSLRKADKVSVRRAGFALKLRDLEAYSRGLPSSDWETLRHAFLNSFIRHVLVLPAFFDFYNYLPRVLAIAVNCEDFTHVRKIIDALENIIVQLEKCENTIKAVSPSNKLNSDTVLTKFKNNLKVLIEETIESSFPLRISTKSENIWIENLSEDLSLYSFREANELIDQHIRYLKRDIAYRPLKHYLLPPSLSGLRNHPVMKNELCNRNWNSLKHLLSSAVVEGCSIITKLANITRDKDSKEVPSGLAFPTRPLGIQDLYILHEDPFSERGALDIASALLAQRGFRPETLLPVYDNDSLKLKIPCETNPTENIRITLSSWKTNIDSWNASATGHADPDKFRLDRLYHLLNNIITSRKTPAYLIFPELSIPAHWFLAIVGKLQAKGISLICGVEYLHEENSVHNQVWAALSHNALGFPSTMIYRQDKQRPAIHEEQELFRIAGKNLNPQLRKWEAPPIIDHGGFHFSMLICSELTNIAYRTALRGKVDALFVPEWNQDIESFNALVESAALDIHAYIIQCNDRQYGDSRIRSPHKDSWMRDIVRVKGGIEDYFVTSEIDIQALRAFQSNHRSPSKPFKPVPDGFEIDPSRRVLP